MAYTYHLKIIQTVHAEIKPKIAPLLPKPIVLSSNIPLSQYHKYIFMHISKLDIYKKEGCMYLSI